MNITLNRIPKSVWFLSELGRATEDSMDATEWQYIIWEMGWVMGLPTYLLGFQETSRDFSFVLHLSYSFHPFMVFNINIISEMVARNHLHLHLYIIMYFQTSNKLLFTFFIGWHGTVFDQLSNSVNVIFNKIMSSWWP